MLVFFVLAASAYAFFQVPYVAMPAEITTSYDERTRLMTWRVAILAFTIMLAGATAPVIRDAVGGRDGYRVMGVVMAVVILVGVVERVVGHPSAPIGAVSAGAGSLREQLRVVGQARDFRVLLTTFVLQALATGCMLAGVAYVAEDLLGRTGAATVLFVCFVGPALLLTPLWARWGERVGKKQGYVAASLVLAAGAALAVLARGRQRRVDLRRDRAGGRRLRRVPGLPDGDAARRGGRRRRADRREPGRRLHRRLDRRRDARPGARPGGVRADAGARRLPLQRGPRHQPARLGTDGDRAGLLARARPR